MNCEEERKLRKLKMDVENEFKGISLPATTKPLGVEIPQGHIFAKERRDKIYKIEEKWKTIREIYRKHIKICSICDN